ncbi:DUF885 domain-containing protein [Duganella violaceipulchra]|uniref:DUF885 domain-containing protein n=1 Tax=Duganella violaceipulchra TaxID=2849652 RepID=A0AA41L3Z9_9BURK|nr:DUF885 domain-containing protein [Duganella violaceicalia]MBV6320367.1 DUF885 domain-containing protein [Duganella violaceicalia]MCP2011816.1 uncharacterized protein (DUF885 family) [Duganella violaceicalia]
MHTSTRFIALLAGASFTLAAHGASFDDWADKVANAKLRNDPEQATQKQYFSGKEQDRLDRKLTPNSIVYRAGEVAAAKTALAQLARIDQQTLTPQQRASAASIAWNLRGTVDAWPYVDYNFVFNQFGGLHVQLVNFLTQAHPIRNQRDVENYLVRLKAVAGKMDTGIVQARGAAGHGILMPTFLTQSSIGQLDRFLDGAPENNVFVATLKQRMSGLKDVSPEQQAKFAAAAEAIVKQSIIPVFQRARAMLQDQLPRTTNDAGLWRLPNGDKAYALLLKQMTSTDYTPEQIHNIGLQEVARIEKEMDGLLASLGYTDGGIKERMAKLEKDSQPKDADPRPALLARYDGVLRDAEARAKELFDVTPKAPVVVKREPPFTEKTAAAHYTGPAKDGTRPGIFWAPMPGPDFRIVGMRTLVYHEGVPGHHFQVALQQENDKLPRYRRDRVFAVGSAYGEGWALYAEQLAAENNWYDGDVVGHLGQLDAELFRARRLVVDTGLHAMKWTRQQGIDYGIPAAEVERYVAMPGQACAYKIGMMRILDLRAKAQKALGEKFSIKAFHNVVLETGNVPLPVLEQVVDEWIAAQ